MRGDAMKVAGVRCLRKFRGRLFAQAAVFFVSAKGHAVLANALIGTIFGVFDAPNTVLADAPSKGVGFFMCQLSAGWLVQRSKPQPASGAV